MGVKNGCMNLVDSILTIIAQRPMRASDIKFEYICPCLKEKPNLLLNYVLRADNFEMS